MDELPETINCTNGDCEATMRRDGNIYRCPMDGEMVTANTVRRKMQEAKQVVAA